MTEYDAIQIAKAVAETEKWPWRQPVSATRYRTFFIFGRAIWYVMSNADQQGGNVNVQIDDTTGEILQQGYAGR